jgi:hypothetical protein
LTLSFHHYKCQKSVQIFHWASATLASCLVHSYITTNTICVMLTEKNNKLSVQHCGCKPSLKSEKWSAISRVQNGALQSKRMADKVCL